MADGIVTISLVCSIQHLSQRSLEVITASSGTVLVTLRRMLQEAGHGGKFEAEDEALKKAEKSLAEQAVRPRPSPGGEAGFVFTEEQVAAFFPLDVPAAWEYEAMESDELSLRPGQVVRVKQPFEDEGWVVAEIGKARGIVPTPYLTRMLFPDIDAAMSSKPSRPDWLDDKPLPVKNVEPKQDSSDIAPKEIPRPTPPMVPTTHLGKATSAVAVAVVAAAAAPAPAPAAAPAAPSSGGNPASSTGGKFVVSKDMLPMDAVMEWDFDTTDPEELPMKKGEKLKILAMGDDEGWVVGQGKAGVMGLVPTTHLGKATSTPAAPGGVPQAATGTKVATAEWNYEAQVHSP